MQYDKIGLILGSLPAGQQPLIYHLSPMLIKGILFLLCCVALQAAGAQGSAPLAQYPSPMQEGTRRHGRINFKMEPSQTIVLNGVLSKPVTVYLPHNIRKAKQADVLVHFHGAASVVAYAAGQYKKPLIAVAVNLGSGSSAYAQPFNNDSTLTNLKQAVLDTVAGYLGRPLREGRLILSGFSAGYGAVRSILRQPAYWKSVHAVLLLDGLHASYIPERQVLAEGGRIDSISLEPFVNLALAASNASSGKSFLFTHSEIFPGTFASTTETAGYLLNRLGVKMKPVLKWGPLGMQQISEASAGNLWILGFAGNTAPDHIDHLQSLYYFLQKL